MSIACIWCGQSREIEEEETAGLCVVCQLQLDTTGTLWTYRDPTLTALVDDMHQRWPDRRGGA